MYNNNNKFDIDLAYGQVKEKELAKILFEKKIEVKSDKIWKKTGNIAVEFKCNGKPSGISVSEAEFYAFILDDNNTINSIIILPTGRLKDIARKHKKNRVFGGDNNLAEMILIPINELLWNG